MIVAVPRWRRPAPGRLQKSCWEHVNAGGNRSHAGIATAETNALAIRAGWRGQGHGHVAGIVAKEIQGVAVAIVMDSACVAVCGGKD